MAHTIGFVLGFLVLAKAWAQDPARRSPVPPRTGDSQFDLRMETELALDDNVYRLRDRNKRRLEANSPADQASGRWNDMESEDDFILSTDLRAAWKGPNEFRLGAAMESFAENGARNHLALYGGADLALGRRLTLGLSVRWESETFKMNYLADATDLTGFVDDFERVYRPGTFEALQAKANLRYLIWRNGESKVHGSISAGRAERAFESPFQGRDQEAVSLGAGLEFDWGEPELALRITLTDVESPTRNEVLVLDEPEVLADLNGDGDAADFNRRTVQAVNRSRQEVSVRVAGKYGRVRVWVEREKSDFYSRLPFDLNHRDREDAGTSFGGSVEVDVANNVDGRLSLEVTDLDSNRRGDPDPALDEGDYENRVISFSVAWRF